MWSADGKQIGSVTYPAGLIEPGCQGSIINNLGSLYLSNPNTTSGRTHMTVKQSKDKGGSWSEGVSVWKGPSGYSQLVSLGQEGVVGLLFEAGAKGTYETISFVAVNV